MTAVTAAQGVPTARSIQRDIRWMLKEQAMEEVRREYEKACLAEDFTEAGEGLDLEATFRRDLRKRQLKLRRELKLLVGGKEKLPTVSTCPCHASERNSPFTKADPTSWRRFTHQDRGCQARRDLDRYIARVLNMGLPGVEEWAILMARVYGRKASLAYTGTFTMRDPRDVRKDDPFDGLETEPDDPEVSRLSVIYRRNANQETETDAFWARQARDRKLAKQAAYLAAKKGEYRKALLQLCYADRGANAPTVRVVREVAKKYRVDWLARLKK